MRLRTLHLDAMVPVPGFSTIAGSPKGERVMDFDAADGWDIAEIAPGVFSVTHESMREPVVIGGYGYSYARASEPAEEPKKRGKR